MGEMLYKLYIHISQVFHGNLARKKKEKRLPLKTTIKHLATSINNQSVIFQRDLQKQSHEK